MKFQLPYLQELSHTLVSTHAILQLEPLSAVVWRIEQPQLHSSRGARL